MKKLLIFLLSILCCFPCVALAGCKNDNQSAITMSRYFKNEVKYRIYPSSENSEQKGTLEEFTHSDYSKPNQYMYVTLTGTEWLYRMNIDYISFDVYSNQNDYVEFVVTMTNLENSDNSSTGGTSYFEYKAGVDLKEKSSVNVKIPVNDIVETLSSTTTTLKIAVANTHFYIDGANTGLNFDIYNISVYGEHIQENI